MRPTGTAASRRARWLLAACVCGLALTMSACGGSQTVVVSAAASLQHAFARYATQFKAAPTRFSFAGSDALAAQIEQGARPDVFASANLKLPRALHLRGLVDQPVVFAANRLVLAVPTRSHKVSALADVQKPGVTLCVGTPSVPVGDYTQTVLQRLPAGERARVLANVRDREPDVNGIVGKLIQGAADAGFLYQTDVTAAHGSLRAIALPAALAPQVAYAAAVVRGSAHPTEARAFIDGLVHGTGAADLRAVGFERPPG